MDAKPRELYLLFRAYKGFEGSLLKVTNKNGKNLSVFIYFFIQKYGLQYLRVSNIFFVFLK
jgi:hypothetical protein